MTDRPIIFSAPMVQALLDGRKSMTRRLAWRDGPAVSGYDPHHQTVVEADTQLPTVWQRAKPGDRLWVRENFAARIGNDHKPDPNPRYVKYRATYKNGKTPNDPMDWHRWPGRWTPSIHMPRWASRITLAVTSTKIERVRNISETDAKAEGAMFHDGHGVGHSGWRHDYKDVFADAKDSFERLWRNLHGDDSWLANPEVVALTFTVHEKNIDEMEKAA